MSDDEFLDLTPSRFAVLVRAWRERERRRDHGAALICAVLANIHRGKDADAFTAADFLPMTKEEREEHEAAKVRESQRALAAVLRGGRA